MQTINDIPGAPGVVGPYSVATRGAGLLFCSGQIGIDPKSGQVPEGIDAQATQVMENLSAVLKGAGSSWDRVLMTTIFLSDMGNYQRVNEIYGSYINKAAAPARQTVAVRELPRSVLIEISIIAE